MAEQRSAVLLYGKGNNMTDVIAIVVAVIAS